MIDLKLKIQHLDKILASPGFSKTKRYKELLGYLVQAEIDGKSVKETTIAIDLFDKDETFDPSEDTIVRVCILNIRKKLANYYFTDGASDSIRIEIPKGTYDIVFKQVQPLQKIIWNQRRKYLFRFQLLLLVFSIIGVAFLFLENKGLKDKFHPIKKDHPIWHEFINAEVPTLLVLGDYFFMYEMYDNRRIFIRDSRVNSIEEYEAKIKPLNNQLNSLEFTYLSPSLATLLLDLIPILNIGDQKTQAKLSSVLEWSDFDQSNIIHTGSYKSLYKIKSLLPLFHIQVQVDSAYVLHKLDETGDVVESFELPRGIEQGNFMTDYSFIGKIKGPGNNTVLLIASGDEVGLTQAVKTITSPDFLDDLKSQFSDISFENPFYFEMILKTEGFGRTGFTSDIVYFKEISVPE